MGRAFQSRKIEGKSTAVGERFLEPDESSELAGFGGAAEGHWVFILEFMSRSRAFGHHCVAK